MIAIADPWGDQRLVYQQVVNKSVNKSVNKLEITVNNYGYKSYSQLLSSYSQNYSQISNIKFILTMGHIEVIHILTVPYK